MASQINSTRQESDIEFRYITANITNIYAIFIQFNMPSTKT